MIPILFNGDDVLPDKYNGVESFPEGYRLPDCISAVVSEELNGKYELKIEYPLNGANAEEIAIGKIIAATPNQYRWTDPDAEYWKLDYFRVYKTTTQLNGVLLVECEHISYILSQQLAPTFSASSAGEAMTKIKAYYTGDQPFYLTATSTSGAISSDKVGTIREALLQLPEVYGGDLEYTHYEVRFYAGGRQRHSTPWQIRYGANMTDLKMDIDWSDFYTQIRGYWGGTIGNVVEIYSGIGEDVPPLNIDSAYQRVLLLDVSGMGGQQTVASITQKATEWKNARKAEDPHYFYPKASITCSPIAEITAQDIYIGDPVSVVVPQYNIVQASRVVAYDWDVLLNRYNKLTIGTIKNNIGLVLAEIEGK